VATWETVRAILSGFPETTEGTSYRTPAFRVRKALLVRLREEGDVVVVHGDPQMRAALLAAGDPPFFTLPHYDREGSPYVLVRLGEIGDDDLVEVLTDAWLRVAPPKLAAGWRQASAGGQPAD
jgi:hypothetical protein